jgi:outer membrane lipoprotein SlyB
MMKKLLVFLMCLTLLVAAALPAAGMTRHRRHHARYSRTSRTYYTYAAPRRTFWQKHRDKLTVAGGALGGALIGGIAGGHKGAGIGALAGAGTSALYTYKLRKRHHHRY